MYNRTAGLWIRKRRQRRKYRPIKLIKYYFQKILHYYMNIVPQIRSKVLSHSKFPSNKNKFHIQLNIQCQRTLPNGCLKLIKSKKQNYSKNLKQNCCKKRTYWKPISIAKKKKTQFPQKHQIRELKFLILL